MSGTKLWRITSITSHFLLSARQKKVAKKSAPPPIPTPHRLVSPRQTLQGFGSGFVDVPQQRDKRGYPLTPRGGGPLRLSW